VLSQRFGVILPFVSLPPRALSREPCRPPLPDFLHLFACQCQSGCRSARGRRAREPCAHSSSSPPLFSSPGRGGAVRLHAKPAHTRQVALRCFPWSCYSHPSACSSRAGAPSRLWLSRFSPPKSHVPWPAPPSTRRPGGLTDARCLLLLHHSRRGAGHVTPRMYSTAGHAAARHRRASVGGENIHNPPSWCLARSFPCHEIRLAPARGTRTHTRTTRRKVNTSVNGRPSPDSNYRAAAFAGGI
jgi:hypothetical protein